MRLNRFLINRCTAVALQIPHLMAADAASASVYPHAEGAKIMADWVVLAFIIFFGSALVVFLLAVRRGYLRNLEDAKYYLLSIDEPDYYTPDWIKEADSDDYQK